MVGVSQQQEIDAMPDGMAKQILLKVIHAPKAPVERLEKETREFMARVMKVREEQRKAESQKH